MAGLLVAANPASLPGPGGAADHAGVARVGAADATGYDGDGAGSGGSGSDDDGGYGGPSYESPLSVGDPSSTVLPELNVLAVTEGPAERAEQSLRSVLEDIDAAHADANRAERDEQRFLAAGSELDVEAAGLRAAHTAAVAARDRALEEAAGATIMVAAHGGRVEAANAVLEAVAVQAYITGNVLDLDDVIAPRELAAGHAAAPKDGAAPDELFERDPALRRTTYLDEVAAGQRAIRQAEQAAMSLARATQQAALQRASGLRDQRIAVEADQATNAAALGRNHDALQLARQGRQDALARAARRANDLVDAKVNLAEARRTATVKGTDLPLVVLDALVRAERRHAVDHPACHLSWSLLAGVSRVESGHGDVGPGVDASGTTHHILGPRLAPETGENVAVVVDSDGGALDGDPLYDRAVGPMQFIPSSWRLYGRDGNADGVADPHNYYDAALAAGEHLCRGGHDTATPEGRRAALLDYNRSESYQRTVSDLADRYAGLRW